MIPRTTALELHPITSKTTSSIDVETSDASRPFPCRHCGTHFKPSAAEKDFCCTGCAYVYRLIRQEGLDQFYQLKGVTPTEPVQSRAFEHRDHAWLLEAVAAAESESDAKDDAHLGLFVQQHSFWSRLTKVRKLIFDKTGTLTEDVPALANPSALDALSAPQRRALARLVKASAHPVSRSICEALASRDVMGTDEIEQVSGQIEEVAGVGLAWADATGRRWTLQRGRKDGLAATEFREDGELRASLQFTDALRNDALGQLESLRRKGYAPYIMSGDDNGKVRRLAEELQFPPSHYRGDMTPEAKADWVQELDRMDTLYLGDGANDSLAFDRAYCTATPAAARALIQEKADAYFMGCGLSFLTPLLLLANRRHRAIARVFAFAVVYNLIAVSLCLAGVMSPLAAAILMPLSSLLTLGIVGVTFKGANH